jgi:hypothetical protein
LVIFENLGAAAASFAMITAFALSAMAAPAFQSVRSNGTSGRSLRIASLRGRHYPLVQHMIAAS